MNTLSRPEATALVHAEQDYALAVHGEDQHSLHEWLSFIRSYADRAMVSCAFDHDPVSARNMRYTLRVIGGLAITAIEQHGAPSRQSELDERPF